MLISLPGDDLRTSHRLFVRSLILCIFCFHICVFVAIKIKLKTDVLTMKNYPSEDSIKVARQLKIVSQRDAFTFSAARNTGIQCVLKMLVCLIAFVKYIFDFYLNNINHIDFLLHLCC